MEVKEIKGVEEKNCGIAAFFDLDGTLMPLPSLERRFFRMLRYRHEIPPRNYLYWLGEALRLLPRGLHAVAHANKMYLKGVRSSNASDGGNCSEFSADAKKIARDTRWSEPRFFEEAIERVMCHAMLGHAIGLVSGTLERLANAAARALEAELAARGFATSVHVCATRLEGFHGRWTGKIVGEAMFGTAKARALRRLEQELGLDLARSWAYGDAATDRWMLEAVGHPAAVNPTGKLARIARARGWPALRWKENKLTQQTQSSQRTRKNSGESASTRPGILRAHCKSC
jgi:HAD superfamily hydrolase (TIGR01490 family)